MAYQEPVYKIMLEDPTEPEEYDTAQSQREARRKLKELAESEDALYKEEYEHCKIDWDDDRNGFWLQLWDGPDGYRLADSRYQAHVGIWTKKVLTEE